MCASRTPGQKECATLRVRASRTSP
jgi:hypothetical protein